MKGSAPWLVALMFPGAICASATFQQQQYTQAETDEIRRTIVEWFECEECREGQLVAVVKLGDKAAPTLIATLREGPPAANREALRASLSKTFEQMSRHAEKYPQAKLPVSEQEYVNIYMENYVARYQSRSAKALGLIGGEAAVQALREALETSLRDDVKAVIRDALK